MASVPDRIAFFEKHGVEWPQSSDEQWMESLEEVKSFAVEHGRLPKRGEPGSRWVRAARSAYRGKELKRGNLITISQKRIELLEAIPGWTWEKDFWMESFEGVMDSAKSGGDLPHWKSSGGQWILNARRAKRDGTLSQERIDLCESIPSWTWHPEHAGAFIKNFQEVSAFAAEHGRLPKWGEPGGRWVTKTRMIYKGKVKYPSGKLVSLSQERIELCESIPGWTWKGKYGPSKRS